ncbi:hypothetical protein H0H93_010172 [Arthromyces matolae]|nr:hypothetical protein H0H93_010172 [Arthromyces matolae]
MAGPSQPRQRKPRSTPEPSTDNVQDDEHVNEVYQNPRNRNAIEQLLETPQASVVVVSALTALAFALRFYKINAPDQVVFDEVHFGKFASHYLRREYYFDVHPPFAKMLFALAGWFVGFDGNFQFETIGDSYTTNLVPYVGLRALPAILGSLTIPVVYAIMKESGYSTVIAAFSAAIVLFDNAHVTQARLILLDAALIFFMSLTIYAYIRFRKLRYREFSSDWWTWLITTGVFMACTWGAKVNGILTVFTIGIAVLIDLWDILDVKKNPNIEYFWKHFWARVVGLIIVPFIVYLSFFYIHFAILTRSGPGDTFMSPAFQETLLGNDMLLNSQEIRYYDTITMRHKETKAFLHSHTEKYPLTYDDGRISSQACPGQQVTGYGHNDTNNNWQIIPTKALPETGRGRVVRNNDVVQLLHVNTRTHLLTHDVASPLMPTNQEFTTWAKDDLTRHNDTLFQIVFNDGHEGQAFRSKSGYFRLVHVPTKVSMWIHGKQLPDWAFNQLEVNGNKNPTERTATWFVDGIISDENGEDPVNRESKAPKKEPKSMNFFRKFAELQLLMLQHNAGLTASHPYASSPINWPFLLSGISFWTQSDTSKQIYLIGNLVGWWTCVVTLSIYVGILGADLLARRRGVDPIPDPARNRLWNNAGFFFVVWAVHYAPFFLMNRQLFIHHYLPSHLASALIAGAVLNFVLSDTINYPISHQGPTTRARPSQYSDIGIKGPVIFVIFCILMLAMFIFIAPLTYGTPGPTSGASNQSPCLHPLGSTAIMFNAPRPAQRYTGSSSAVGFGSGSFVDENPLANSVYDDGLDPWSAAPSPAPTPIPQHASSVFNSVIADAKVPPIYNAAFAAADPSRLGETSINSLSRILSTSALPAATIDKVWNKHIETLRSMLTHDSFRLSILPRVSKLEFFVALALVALSQAGKDVSIEQVAALSSQNTLPEPALDLSRFPASNLPFTTSVPNYRRDTISDDPWNVTPQYGPPPNSGAIDTSRGGLSNGVPSSLAGTGLPDEWWKKQEVVRVNLLGPQGFILNRYMVYEVATDRGNPPVHRRYSEFVFLWDVLLQRYPFRLFPALPPKRIGADEQFLEQRRRGLARALNFVINHPVIKDDGLIAVFLTEPSLETWRKHSSVSLDEESASKRVDRIEEMTIPSDLEDKLAGVRVRLNPLIDQWQRICILAERIIRRQEAAAVRSPPALRRTYLPTHFSFPIFIPSPPSSPRSTAASASIFSESSTVHNNYTPTADEFALQGDLTRLTNTLRAVVEVNGRCWRGDECELSNGVRLGLEQFADHAQRHSELSESRSHTLLDNTLEALKTQRDLYLATRDLLIRHDRLSIDQVERLKKRVETNSLKLDGIRSAQREGWEEEVDRLTSLIERDQASIAAQLSRRVFIRASMWHELRVVLHNRENTLVTQMVHKFSRDEREFAERVLNNWVSLGNAVEAMPYE